jgi:uncharacterized SAM-binding protein YcdF (DUF218 family)
MALFLLREPILTAVGGLLLVEDRSPPRADLIVLLNGGLETRPFRAAELYREGRAARIVIAQSERLPTQRMGLLPNSTDVSTGVLHQLGVPLDAITVLPFHGGTASTADEVRALRSFLRHAPANRLIVVTSDYHTRRTKWLLRRYVGDMPVDVHVEATPEAFGPSDWWRSEAGLIVYIEEFLKLGRSALSPN